MTDLEIVKLATESSTGLRDVLKTLAPFLYLSAGTGAAAGVWHYINAKNRLEAHQEGLSRSFNSIATAHPKTLTSPNFAQRFAELAFLAPSIASNPSFAHKMIEPRLKEGFDLDDVHRLAAVEYHTAFAPKIPTPAAAATEGAARGFGQSFYTMLPSVANSVAMIPARKAEKVREAHVHKMQSEIAAVHKRDAAMQAKIKPGARDMVAAITAKINQERQASMTKKSSDQMTVSEECMGRMLADRYCMYKAAAAGGFFNPGVKALEKYVKLMTLPLLIGGGIGLVQKLMKEHETDQTRKAADSVYASIRRSSDLVKENPEMANEAFDSLRSFAPSLAAKPIIARTFIEHIVRSNGMLPPDTANTLAKTQQLLDSMHTQPGFLEGLKNPMSIFKHSVSGTGKEEK
jgi:hypothetical protein